MDYDKLEYYSKLLELDYNFTEEELKISYYKLIKKYHPDRYPDKESDEYKYALDKFNEITHGYNYLKSYIKNFKSIPNKTINSNELYEEEKLLEQYYLNGVNLYKKGNINSALDCFLVCHRKQPTITKYIRFIIRCLFTKQRRLQEALEYSLKLIELEPTRNENYYLLGKNYFLLGNNQLALKYLKIAKDMNYSLEDIDQLIDKLEPKSFIKKMLKILKK
ncbi:MAG: DnaJ domain-containing protein [Deferribacterales bacterium]